MSCILSICIPTYNRAQLLRECLESIAVSRRVDEIAVTISDNASTDDTSDVVDGFRGRLPALIYHRGDSLIDAHLNFRCAAELASTPFVWIFGDDDQLQPAAIESVLLALESGAEALVLNAAVFDKDMRQAIKSRLLPINSDVTFDDRNRLLAQLGVYPGWISSVVLPRDPFLSIPLPAYMEFARDGGCFIYASYAVFRNCGNVKLLASPLIRNRGSVPLEFGPAEEESGMPDRQWEEIFGCGFPRATEALGELGYSKQSIRAAHNRTIMSYLLPRLLLLKTSGRSVRGLCGVAANYLRCCWSFWLLLVPAAMLPPAMLLQLRWIKRRIAGEPVDRPSVLSTQSRGKR